MIWEDGTEIVNSSDEDTVFVLSEPTDVEARTPVVNPVLSEREQYEVSQRFQDTWAAKLP